MRKNRLPRKVTSSIALVTAGTLALAGCSSSDSDGASDSGDEVTLTFASWLPTQDQWQDLIAEFEEEHPNINIEFDRNEDYEAYLDRKSTRLNSSHVAISYAVFCLK